jgi:signal transduction protein with GAF and PtsI domain
MLRKKLSVLENTYDGVISLERQDYQYNIFCKWTFFPKEKRQENQYRLTIMLQVQGINIQLTLRSLYSIEHPQTLALIESLAYNQALGLNWIRDTLETPLVMNSGFKKKILDNPSNKKYF